MQDFLAFINQVLWGAILLYLVPATGIWFTLRCSFIQFRYFLPAVKSLKITFRTKNKNITPFQSICTSMAARVGSGNLAGVVIALAGGGPGALFWMWFAALTGMATTFAECTLAQLYKTPNKNGGFRGGPAWYMAHGLGMRWMGIAFSLFLLVAFGLVFNTVQANAIAVVMSGSFSVTPIISGSVLAIIACLVFTRGLPGIARILQWLVPLMAILWISVSLCVMFTHIEQVPGVMRRVIEYAFGWQQVTSGALGYTLSQAIASGLQRAMFSNESGMGSTPNAAATAEAIPAHPASQGIVQMAGVMFDTFGICTATAAIVLLSDSNTDVIDRANSINMLQNALSTLSGAWGADFVAFITVLFAFTSVLANYSYAENNLSFLHLDSPRIVTLLRVIVSLTLLAGALSSIDLVWSLADIIMAFMAITNLTAILLLSPVVRDVTLDYHRQRKLGQTPTFDPDRFPDISGQLFPGVWKVKK